MIHVIIPTTGIPELERTLSDYAKFIPHCRLIVVLNTDDPDCVPDVMGWFATATAHREDCAIVSRRGRCGYLRACKLGYATAEPEPDDYVVLLNDDVEATGDWVTPLQEALDEGAAQVGPAMRRVGWSIELDKTEGCYHYLEGWCFMVKASTVEAVGGLYDDAFAPGYSEDEDLSVRISMSGGVLAQIPIPLSHLRSTTFGRCYRPFRERNVRYLIRKWSLDRPGMPYALVSPETYDAYEVSVAKAKATQTTQEP